MPRIHVALITLKKTPLRTKHALSVAKGCGIQIDSRHGATPLHPDIKRNKRKRPSPNENACFLSHSSAWKNAEKKKGWLIVFEDDFVPKYSFVTFSLLQRILKSVPGDISFVNFGVRTTLVRLGKFICQVEEGVNLRRGSGRHYHSYAIRCSALPRWIKLAEKLKFQVPIDFVHDLLPNKTAIVRVRNKVALPFKGETTQTLGLFCQKRYGALRSTLKRPRQHSRLF
jgi:GR25 family glycosyltransferase involved in LPS biosynthesis